MAGLLAEAGAEFPVFLILGLRCFCCSSEFELELEPQLGFIVFVGLVGLVGFVIMGCGFNQNG